MIWLLWVTLVALTLLVVHVATVWDKALEARETMLDELSELAMDRFRVEGPA